MISLQPLVNALRSLEDSLSPPPANDRERDGAIQRFEYTFELAWKMGKAVLAKEGLVAESPKETLRQLGKAGWIDDVPIWFEFHAARNESTHVYRQMTAERVFDVAKRFPAECQKLLRILEEKNTT